MFFLPHKHARYALVEEISDRGWWLPGGGVDEGDIFPEAASMPCILHMPMAWIITKIPICGFQC